MASHDKYFHGQLVSLRGQEVTVTTSSPLETLTGVLHGVYGDYLVLRVEDASRSSVGVPTTHVLSRHEHLVPLDAVCSVQRRLPDND
jgi:hypothetical protein